MQCVYNKHLRCKNTYWVKGEEFISCWGENYAFLETLAEYFFEDGVTGLPWEKLESAKFKPPSNTLQVKHAEVYGWFGEQENPDKPWPKGYVPENYIEHVEPWVRSGALNMSAERLKAIGSINIYMDSLICAILRVAEWRFLDSAFRERGR